MIITRSPLRISLGGGGTDLPSYYREFGGFVISAAIDKYVYITLHETFQQAIIAKYSKLETVQRWEDLKHPILREALSMVGIEATPHLEIASMSDIPAGTGLGSSGSFTTALLRALYQLKKQHVSRQEVAERACEIEIDRLGEPVGKQDQYISSFGGVTCFTIARDGQVLVEPLRVSTNTLHDLEDSLCLFFTGFTRSASDILRDQEVRTRGHDPRMIDNLHFVKQLGFESKAALESGDLRRYAQIMHIHWEHKKNRSAGMSNPEIDAVYQTAREHGALGGKLIGAGGGGFLMFYTEDRTRLRRAMLEKGLREVRFRFDFAGASVVSQA